MIDYLIEREREENFCTSTRTLTFPDGETRRIEAYRIIWTWFDRIIDFEFGPTKSEILKAALDCANEEGLPIEHALGLVLNYLVKQSEVRGLDYTDHNPPMMLANESIQRFHN